MCGLEDNRRKTRNERRDEYFERMDAKAEACAELERERLGGVWRVSDEDDAVDTVEVTHED